MEPRNDSTWLMVGVGAGCLFVLMTMMCLVAGILFYSSRSSSGPAPVTVGPTPTPPTTWVAPPPTFVPPTSLPPPPLPPGTTAPEDLTPRVVHATIASVTGTPGVSVGQTCDFNVERRDRDDGSGFWCNAQIVCGGHLLYGGPTAGFFPCTLFHAPVRGVVGSDPLTTAQDQDAAMSIDTVQSHLEIWDDAQGPSGEFRVIAHIDTLE
jgi:hypothetical protein